MVLETETNQSLQILQFNGVFENRNKPNLTNTSRKSFTNTATDFAHNQTK